MLIIESNDGHGNIMRRLVPTESFGGNQGGMRNISPLTHFFTLLERLSQRHGQKDQGLTKEEIK